MRWASTPVFPAPDWIVEQHHCSAKLSQVWVFQYTGHTPIIQNNVSQLKPWRKTTFSPHTLWSACLTVTASWTMYTINLSTVDLSCNYVHRDCGSVWYTWPCIKALSGHSKVSSRNELLLLPLPAETDQTWHWVGNTIQPSETIVFLTTIFPAQLVTCFFLPIYFVWHVFWTF